MPTNSQPSLTLFLSFGKGGVVVPLITYKMAIVSMPVPLDLSRSDESGLSAATTNASSSSVEGGPLPPTAHLDGVVNFSICCVGIVVNSTAIGILLR